MLLVCFEVIQTWRPRVVIRNQRFCRAPPLICLYRKSDISFDIHYTEN